MVALGALVPGTQPQAVTGLIVAGSSLTVLAVLAPVYREFEIGPTKFRLSRGDSEPPAPWVVAEAENLANVARWVLGESELARNAVEDTLSMVRRVGRRIPRDAREMTKLKTLVALLDKADQKRTLPGGRRRDGRPTNMIDALQSLDFPDRIAFALRSEYPIKEVAEILNRSEAEVAANVERARDALASYETTQGPADGG
jgi:hypothetical protein